MGEVGPSAWGLRLPADVKLNGTTAQDKPVLNRETFQQLLAAAYVLQEQNEHLHPEAIASRLHRGAIRPG